jgi:hypothetical protein
LREERSFDPLCENAASPLDLRRYHGDVVASADGCLLLTATKAQLS